MNHNVIQVITYSPSTHTQICGGQEGIFSLVHSLNHHLFFWQIVPLQRYTPSTQQIVLFSPWNSVLIFPNHAII